MNDSLNSQLFLKFLKSKCANLRLEIESLLHDVCNWVVNAEEQARQAGAGGSTHLARHTPDYAPQQAHLDVPSRAPGVPSASSPLRRFAQSAPKNYISRNHPINPNPNISCKKEDDQINQDKKFAPINQDHDSYKNKDSLNKNKIIKKSIKAKDIKPKKSIHGLRHYKMRAAINFLDQLKNIQDFDFDPSEMIQISKNIVKNNLYYQFGKK